MSRRGMNGIIRKYHMERKFDISKSVSVRECLNDLSVMT